MDKKGLKAGGGAGQPKEKKKRIDYEKLKTRGGVGQPKEKKRKQID